MRSCDHTLPWALVPFHRRAARDVMPAWLDGLIRCTPCPKSGSRPASDAAVKLAAHGEVRLVGFIDPAFVFGHRARVAVKVASDGRRRSSTRLDGFENAL